MTCPIERYHPAIIAQAAATVSCFAPGRTYLGVGTGEALNEYPVTTEWPEYKERLERLEEAIQLIRALWGGQSVSFDGRYYQTQKAKLYTLPASPIPIYISVLIPRRAMFAGKFGDGLFSVGGKKPEVYRQMIQSFEEGAREAGKEPSHMPRLIELNVAYTEKIDAAIQEQIKYWAGTYVPAMFAQKIYTPAMSQENGEIVGPETIKKTGCFSSSSDDHIQFLQQYIELGFNILILHSPGPDQHAFIERYGRDILPKIRTMAPSQPVLR